MVLLLFIHSLLMFNRLLLNEGRKLVLPLPDFLHAHNVVFILGKVGKRRLQLKVLGVSLNCFTVKLIRYSHLSCLMP